MLIGSSFLEGGTPKTHNNTKGLGARLRRADRASGCGRSTRFRVPGEFGNDTWLNESWAVNGNVGVWNQMAVDEELGLAYLPVETPSSDFYGGLRPGNNLFAESLVAIDYKTGRRKWHFQLVHHPIWNMDIAAAPMLVDLTVDGQPVKAVAVMGKQAMLYLFNRVTGEPIFPIEERPVPQSDVPGEKTSPTQPFPTKPPPYDHQGVTLDNLIDFTPELRAEALKIASRYKIGPIFTPPPVSRAEGPIAGFRSSGGTNWPGGSFDPETHIAYVPSFTAMPVLGLLPPPNKEFSDLPYVSGNALTGVRYISGPGENAGADAPRAHRAAAARRRPLSTTNDARRQRQRDAAGAAAAEAAVRPAHGDQPRSRRDRLAGAARRDARQRPQSSGAEGADHSAHRANRARSARWSPRRSSSSAIRWRRPAPNRPRGAMLRAYDKATARRSAPSTCRRSSPGRR